MNDVAIVSTARTGLAKSWKGAFNMTYGPTLAAHSIEHAVKRELPNVEVVGGGEGREVLLMVQGDINPLLRRLAGLEVRDITITTPDIEDVFMRFYGTSGTPSSDASGGGAPGAGSSNEDGR